ncbi:MAG: SDR family NAD(P)-dependent oxidoreductase [Planctomycetota bacterium]|jgi:NAD(P)-dependent dehydrogenase (short-subunit alcohol dehydrogenase family)
MSAEIALVTGASRGIGRAVAEKLAAAGYRLAITSRDQVRLARAAQEIGGDVFAHAADLRRIEELSGLIQAVRKSCGNPNILINNAGIAPTAKFEKTDEEMLEASMDLHLRAPFALIRAFLPGMRSDGKGCILQIASTAGLRGFSYTSAYCAAKHAMLGMSRSLAEELKSTPIRSYAVCPGFVDTDITRGAARAIAERAGKAETKALEELGAMNRIGRLHSPEEVADAVVQLCRERPEGCVYNLDAEPACFVEDP